MRQSSPTARSITSMGVAQLEARLYADFGLNSVEASVFVLMVNELVKRDKHHIEVLRAVYKETLCLGCDASDRHVPNGLKICSKLDSAVIQWRKWVSTVEARRPHQWVSSFEPPAGSSPPKITDTGADYFLGCFEQKNITFPT